uniref:Apelin n=3 Tax=Canis lupus TaxID=9612 RepID=A0A8C0T921_CANLF
PSGLVAKPQATKCSPWSERGAFSLAAWALGSWKPPPSSQPPGKSSPLSPEPPAEASLAALPPRQEREAAGEEAASERGSWPACGAAPEPRELRARPHARTTRGSRLSSPRGARPGLQRPPRSSMNLRRCVQALLLLWLSLTAACGGPLLQPSDGKALEEGNIRHLVQPRGSRNGPGPWQGGRKKFRRQRPRLSHKGPMPF